MSALLVVALGSGLTVFMTTSWQLVLLRGVLVGLGTGSMALSLVATVTGRWFVARCGLVAFGGGVIRDVTGSYDLAWLLAGGLCMVAAAASIAIRRNPPPSRTALPTDPEEAAAAQAHG